MIEFQQRFLGHGCFAHVQGSPIFLLEGVGYAVLDCEYLFEIIMRRYELRSTLTTSNRPLEEWGKLIGDVPAATAILDRFLHHANLIKIKGKSYRMKEAAATAID